MIKNEEEEIKSGIKRRNDDERGTIVRRKRGTIRRKRLFVKRERERGRSREKINGLEV